MKETGNVIVSWVDQRMEEMLAAPRMWGSDEAVELQMLLLLEVRVLALQPEQLVANPRRILDAYAAYLAKTYPTTPNRPLSQIVQPDHLGLTLAAELRKFRDHLVKQYVIKKSSTTGAIGPKRKASHSTKEEPRKNPWAEFEKISLGLPVPPRTGSFVTGVPS